MIRGLEHILEHLDSLKPIGQGATSKLRADISHLATQAPSVANAHTTRELQWRMEGWDEMLHKISINQVTADDCVKMFRKDTKQLSQSKAEELRQYFVEQGLLATEEDEI